MIERSILMTVNTHIEVKIRRSVCFHHHGNK